MAVVENVINNKFGYSIDTYNTYAACMQLPLSQIVNFL